MSLNTYAVLRNMSFKDMYNLVYCDLYLICETMANINSHYPCQTDNTFQALAGNRDCYFTHFGIKPTRLWNPMAQHRWDNHGYVQHISRVSVFCINGIISAISLGFPLSKLSPGWGLLHWHWGNRTIAPGLLNPPAPGKFEWNLR